MEKINIIGVPEHFNYPWTQLVNRQPFLDKDIQLIWNNESKGSGAMNRAIREQTADIAIILTESFIKDKTEGNPGKIIGFHVLSALNWGIHVPSGCQIESVSELKNLPFLVSRMGSGSHLMAYLLAKQEGWNTEELEFEIIGNLEGAIQSFKNNTPKVFLWEKFTTKPYVDKGWFRRVGEIPTPWPSFVIVASEKAMIKSPEVVKAVRDALYVMNAEMMNQPSKKVKSIGLQYQLKEEDVSEWISQTSWATNGAIEKSILQKSIDILSDLNLIKTKIEWNELVDLKMVEWH
ncbi:MAG: ABC transporter substrate-binding protein [Cyclobacteriaceae bacterium]